MAFKTTIGSKILVLLIALLVASVGLYLFLASQTFLRDKIAFIFDLNKNAVTTLASTIDTSLPGVTNQLKFFTLTVVSKSKTQQDALSQVLEDDPLLTSIFVYEKNNVTGAWDLLSNSTQERFKKIYDLNEDFWSQRLIKEKPVPFDRIDSSDKSTTLWNATIANAPPLLGVATKLTFDQVTKDKLTDKETGRKQRILAAVGFIKASEFIKSVSSSATSEVYILDQEGRLLVHPIADYLLKNYNFKAIPIVEDFIKNKSSPLTVKKYNYQEVEFLGAFARTQVGGLGVFSSIESDSAFEAVGILMKRSFIYGCIIVCLVIVIAQIFSKSITTPVKELVEATKRIAAGDLGFTIELKSKDEIEVLGNAFNQMNQDLKASRLELEETNRGLEEKVKERTKELEELATKDPLTGAYNRRFFNARLKEEISRAKRSQTPIGLIYLDIDHFKKYNDTNGHPGGDVLLKQFTGVLKNTVRVTDILARIGGEEFCVIVPDTNLEGAAKLAEKIRKNVETTSFPNGEKQPLGMVSCSLGVSEYPSLASDEEGLVKCADEALYKIKQAARNAVGVGEVAPGYTPPFVIEAKKAG